MKQTLVVVSKQSWSVVPFLGVNRQDIDMNAKKKGRRKQRDGGISSPLFPLLRRGSSKVIARGPILPGKKSYASDMKIHGG